jgi:molecular chaperone DnaK (HSP70)
MVSTVSGRHQRGDTGGGQTRVPAVRALIRGIFGHEPRYDVNPDEAIALGTAIQASVLAHEITDVLPRVSEMDAMPTK